MLQQRRKVHRRDDGAMEDRRQWDQSVRDGKFKVKNNLEKNPHGS